VVIPDSLDGTEEPVALDGVLDSLGTSSERARASGAARAREGRDDTLFRKSLEVLCHDSLETRIELLAICPCQPPGLGEAQAARSGNAASNR